MDDAKPLPTFTSYEDMATFWDTHSLADYWDQTEPATFDVAPEVRRRYVVAVDREVLGRVQRLARTRGISSESLINLLLEQRLRKLESHTAQALLKKSLQTRDVLSPYKVEQGHGAGCLQRPLVPRSRFPPRLMPGVWPR